MTIRILISGEGANEIGKWAGADAPEGERTSGAGTIEALLGKVRPGGWEVCKALLWKDVHKLVPNAHGDGDVKTINGLALRARELGCNALIFLRDRDGSVRRERVIRDAVAGVAQNARFIVAAGVPIEMLECWLLALKGERGAQDVREPPNALFERHRVQPKRTTLMVELVRNSKLLDAPADAVSFWRWIRRAAVALNVKIPSQWPK